METKKDIKQKMREGLGSHDRSIVVTGILNSAAEHINNAFRDLANAIQYIEDDKLKKAVEEVKELISHEIQTNKVFADDKQTILSKIKVILNYLKPDKGSDMYTE
jgi:iron-sulfur cluster repair protein YtfE (RIC family)